jgi:hypothetical protein
MKINLREMTTRVFYARKGLTVLYLPFILNHMVELFVKN